MKKVFLDTNVLLDSALARGERGLAATAILTSCEYGQTQGYVSFLTVANMAYILRKGCSLPELKDVLREYTRHLSILPMDETQLELAYDVEAPDFEDALQYECAKSGHCDLIITGNTKHFRFITDIEVVSTTDFAKPFRSE